MSIRSRSRSSHQPAPTEQPWTGHLLNQAALRIRTVTAEALAPLGLTPPLIRVLETIAAAPGRTQAWLGGEVGMDRTTIVHVIDRLEALDAARRAPDPRDRRSRLIALTPAGDALLIRGRAIGRGVEDAFLAPCPPRNATYSSRCLSNCTNPKPVDRSTPMSQTQTVPAPRTTNPALRRPIPDGHGMQPVAA